MFEFVSSAAESLRRQAQQTFRSLANPNFRKYAIGQFISMAGSWMQNVALMWITYSLTNSALILGLSALCANAPALVLGFFGGSVADKYNRQRILITVQWASMAVAATMTVLVASGLLEVWMVLALSLVQGVILSFELPARQAFVNDIIDKDDLVNAISINAVIFNTTRLVGPTLAAVALATVGETACFVANTLSFGAAIITLRMIKVVQSQSQNDGSKRSFKAAIQLAMSMPDVRNILVITACTSFFAFQVGMLLPVFVREIFLASSTELAQLTAAMSGGSLLGALFLASRSSGEGLRKLIKIGSVGLCCSLAAFALSNSFALSLVIAAFIGCSLAIQLNSSNSMLQLTAQGPIRGRIMGLYTMALVGTAPLGSLAIGALSDAITAPMAVLVCAGACALASVFYLSRK